MTASIRTRRSDGAAGAVAFGALALVAGTGMVTVPCPFRSVTGWACPLCGGSRMFRDVVHLDLPAAFHHNAVGLGVALASIAWLALVVGRRAAAGSFVTSGRAVGGVVDRHRAVALATLIAVLVAWTLLRNGPLAAWDTAT